LRRRDRRKDYELSWDELQARRRAEVDRWGRVALISGSVAVASWLVVFVVTVLRALGVLA
jgi:hypothetical protein